MEIAAIKRGLSKNNDGFVQAVFKKRTDSISQLEKNGDILDITLNIKYLVDDFTGLTDIESYKEKYDSLIKTKSYFKENSDLKKLFESENKAVENYYNSIVQIKSDFNFSDSIYARCLSEISYYSKLEKKSGKQTQDMASRILGNIYMLQYTSGDDFYVSNHYNLAIKCYKLCTEAMPESKYAYYQLACAQSLNKNFKAACKTLEKLIGLGFKKKNVLDTEPAFINMKDYKKFVEIMNQL